jgi:hypothetical protein
MLESGLNAGTYGTCLSYLLPAKKRKIAHNRTRQLMTLLKGKSIRGREAVWADYEANLDETVHNPYPSLKRPSRNQKLEGKRFINRL